MIKLKKKIQNILLVSLIISTVLTVQVSASDSNGKDSILTLEQAVEIATKDSKEVKVIDQKIINALKQLDYANRKANILKTETWSTDEKRAELKKEMELAPIQKKNIVEVLKLQKNEKVKYLKNEIIKAYFTYNLTQEQLNNKKNSINRLNKKLEIIKQQIAKGKASSKSIYDTEVAIKTAEQQYSIYCRDLSNIRININSLLGHNINSDITLRTENIVIPNLDLNIGDILQKNIKESSKILQALNNNAEAKIEYDITNFSSTKVVPDGIEDAENKVLDTDYEYNKLLKDEETNCYNEYNNLLNLRDDVSIKELQMEVNKKDMDKTKVQYDLGLVDIIYYNNTIQIYENSVIIYKQALLDYFIAIENFK